MNPLELAYYLGHLIKSRRDLRLRRRLPSRVISIGNITVGGTGKTPATISLARAACERGLTPIILTRGYKGKNPGPCFVGEGFGHLTDTSGSGARHLPPDPSLCGDEPVLMAEKLPGVAVVKCPDRYRGGLFALETLPAHLRSRVVFIMDDGFQHLRLHRDLDIVLIDGLNPFGNGRLLPLGILREPLAGLGRAGIFVITRCDSDAVRHRLAGLNPGAPVFTAPTAVTGITDMQGRPVTYESLSGKGLFGFCGVGNPGAFRRTLQELPGELRGFESLGDHCSYRGPDVDRLRRRAGSLGCDLLVTTEKDRVKLRKAGASGDILVVEIGLEAGDDFLDAVFRRLPPPA